MRQALFKKLDGNGDGVIDKTELKAAFASNNKTGARRSGSASPNKVFTALDANKDGVISQSEFNAALSKNQTSGSSSLAGATSWLVGLMGAGSGTGAQANGAHMTAHGALKSYLACGKAAASPSAQGFAKVV
jgi:hypothetical protein